MQFNVLLVAEEPVLADITCFRLELLGYSVKHISNAEEAVIWLQAETVHVVLVDQLLPGIDGMEFINRLSNNERTSKLPVVLMSSNADLDEVQKAYIAGADEYLVTPYDPTVLEQKVGLFIADVVS